MSIRYPTNYNSVADIPAALEDMAESIQEELDVKEDSSNKVTSIDNNSTDEEYPSAKLLYNKLIEKQSQIDALVEENTALKNQIPSGTAEGTSITLTDSAEDLPIKNAMIKGRTEQNTYIGKNLFDKNNANILNGYIDYTNKQVHTLSSAKTIYINCEPNTTYTISKILSSRFVVDSFSQIPADSIVGTNQSYNNSATSLTITTGANDIYLAVFCYRTSDTLTFQEIIDSIQIEKGSTATSYEPYCGRKSKSKSRLSSNNS